MTTSLGLYLLLVIVLLCTDCVFSFNFWNATSRNVELPSHFTIDSDNEVIIVAAKNSICHVSIDLQNQFNVLTAEPDSDAKVTCDDDFRGLEVCQNYHHVLALPFGQETIFGLNGTVYSINNTVLVCGSNAFSPMCHYRHRDTLDVLRVTTGVGFCPYNYHPGVASIWLSTGRLVTAAPFDIQEMDFGISMSNSPYNGEVSVTTKFSDRYWFHNSPHFVSMYEIGEFVYVFFREKALETAENVIYSRVARVCKNDPGSSLLAENSEANIFTTFLKARISCSSGTGTSGDIPFHFNEIQDTYFIPSGSGDGLLGMEEHIYAVFTSAENGPVGSAVCVFTFGTSNKGIGNVFNGEYLQYMADCSWTPVDNYQPFTCEPGSRSIAHARDIQLMKSTATSSNGPRPLFSSQDYLFDRIVVSQVMGLDNKTYTIMFIAAHSGDKLVLLKVAPFANQPYHFIRTVELGPYSSISQMKLHGSGSEAHIYVGNRNGIYGVPAAECSTYTDCCSCLTSKDPYCAFDTSSHTCVAVTSSNRGSPYLVQDLVNGNSSICPEVNDGVISTVGTVPSTSAETATVTTSSTIVLSVNGGLGLDSGTENLSKFKDHTWTIVGSVIGFVGGVFLGIIITAFFFRRSNILHHKRDRQHRQRSSRGLEESENQRKSSKCNLNTIGNKPKNDDFARNNRKLASRNEYTAVYPKNTPQVGRVVRFSSKCASPPPKQFTQQLLAPVPITPPTPPFKKTCSDSFSFKTTPQTSPPTPPFKKTCSDSFPFEATPQTTPQYQMMTSPIHLDPNMKSESKTEEPISNQQRAAYGRNILARAPSIDASKSSKYSKTTLPVVSPHIRFGTNSEFVHVQDAELGCSQC